MRIALSIVTVLFLAHFTVFRFTVLQVADAQVTSAQATTAPASSAPVTSSPVTSAPVTSAPVTSPQDDDAVKQAYVAYMQARIDRNLDAARAASTGDDAHRHFLAADIERQLLTDKLQAAMTKFRRISGVTPPSTATPPSSRPGARRSAMAFSK
jgi:hypothetical protein